MVDYEAELGVVIARDVKDVSAADALDYVWGYTIVNDMSARDIQFSTPQWIRGKSLDGFTPVGPWVVTADELGDPQKLAVTLTLNGVELQNGHTSLMMRSVAEIIEHLSVGTTLKAGTLISTGTPSGIGYARSPQVFMHDGDTVVASVEGIGSLITHCAEHTL
jgi:2-keto-4-pentenoate hydratase/2-oxohepta-3-ene-1,7-dioic acid hydratase in catechol pathway